MHVMSYECICVCKSEDNFTLTVCSHRVNSNTTMPSPNKGIKAELVTLRIIPDPAIQAWVS